jgi:hypothetical protein
MAHAAERPPIRNRYVTKVNDSVPLFDKPMLDERANAGLWRQSMFTSSMSAKFAAAILAAGVVATGGAAAAAHVGADASAEHRTDVERTAPAHPADVDTDKDTDKDQDQDVDEDTDQDKGHMDRDKGQGDTISALAKSIPGGPGKGAKISAAAKLHGDATSDAATAKHSAATR